MAGAICDGNGLCEEALRHYSIEIVSASLWLGGNDLGSVNAIPAPQSVTFFNVGQAPS